MDSIITVMGTLLEDLKDQFGAVHPGEYVADTQLMAHNEQMNE